MGNYSEDDLIEAQRAIQSLISKCEKVLEKFSQGTSQYTLLINRINALRISSSLIAEALAAKEAS